jgi:hypothetical protein
MTPAPKRRWFAYSLRTLFVVVTVFAVWLGYSMNWIQQRHKVLNDSEARMKRAGKGYWDIWGPPAIEVDHPIPPPFPLGLFGERGHDKVLLFYIVDALPDGVTPEMTRAQRLFPEARCTWSFVDRDGNWFPSTEE